jgi:release factor glutamine methyltransferase
VPTIKSALADAAKLIHPASPSPLLDAELLLCKVLSKNRTYLRAWPERELSAEHQDAFFELIEQRRNGHPIAYLTGHREFWSREFEISSDALIPRPETELLIELALNLIPCDKPCRIIDLGTGSGIIAVTLAAERPQASVFATDICPAALEIAKRNALKHKTGTIQFYQSRWFDNVQAGKFDFILSNPPYVAENDPHLQQGDLRFEPLTALASGENGLADIRIIAETACARLESAGYLMVEHGYNQESEVKNLFTALGYVDVQTYKDLAGLPRVTAGHR